MGKIPPAFVLIGIEMLSRITSPMCFMSAVPVGSPLGAVAAPAHGPLFQDALNVPPTPPVVADRLGDRVLDPLAGIVLQGVDEVVGDQRSEKADVLFVEPEDVGTLRPHRRGLVTIPEG